MFYQRNPNPTPLEWLEAKVLLGLSRNDVLLLLLAGAVVAALMSQNWDWICGRR